MRDSRVERQRAETQKPVVSSLLRVCYSSRFIISIASNQSSSVHHSLGEATQILIDRPEGSAAPLLGKLSERFSRKGGGRRGIASSSPPSGETDLSCSKGHRCPARRRGGGAQSRHLRDDGGGRGRLLSDVTGSRLLSFFGVFKAP